MYDQIALMRARRHEKTDLFSFESTNEKPKMTVKRRDSINNRTTSPGSEFKKFNELPRN